MAENNPNLHSLKAEIEFDASKAVDSVEQLKTSNDSASGF